MIRKKRFFVQILAFIFLLPVFCMAQSATMPAFKMQLTNGKIFSSSALSDKKPTILIYFAPDCGHCQLLMNELFKKINDFKSAQIVMVTFEPTKELIGFEKHYQTSKYPNIIVGSELPVFFFRSYYQLDRTPFTALFDKKHKTVVSYKEQTPVDGLIKKLKAVQ